jgi:hypothetical protein
MLLLCWCGDDLTACQTLAAPAAAVDVDVGNASVTATASAVKITATASIKWSLTPLRV